MESFSLKLFSAQLADAAQQYPTLKIQRDNKEIPYLKGILDIPNDNKEIIGHFLIEIRFIEDYPNRFPILFETGGVIPNEADWHKYKDGSCCITVWPEEEIICKNGMHISTFIQKYAIPFFANYVHRKITGQYKNGEYSHGIKGIVEYYETLMKTDDEKLWIQYFKNTFRNLKVPVERNDDCFCGSREKYKNCHLEVFNTLRQIGEKRLINDFILMKK